MSRALTICSSPTDPPEWLKERAKEMTEESGWNETTNGAAANEDEWTEAVSETQIILEAIGEGWIGRFMGMDEPNATGIIQTHWTVVTDLDGSSLENGEGCFINATRDLINKLKKVPVKSLVRAQWIDMLDTGHSSGNQMRVFKVQWK